MSSGKIKTAPEVYHSELPEEVRNLMERFPGVREYIERLDFIHEELAKHLSKECLAEIGIRRVDFREVCEKVLLPKVYADNGEKPQSR